MTILAPLRSAAARTTATTPASPRRTPATVTPPVAPAAAPPTTAVRTPASARRAAGWSWVFLAGSVVAAVTGLAGAGFVVVLVAVASGLRAGRRAAHVLAVLCLVAVPFASSAVAVGDLGGRGWVVAGVTLVALAALVRHWRDFGVPVARMSERYVLVLGALLTTVLGTALALIAVFDRGHGSTTQRAVYVLHQAAADLDLRTWSTPVQIDTPVRWAVDLLAAILVASVLHVALRAPRPPATQTPEDEGRVRALLRVHGSRDSLGYFALRRDKSVVFSPSGKAAVAYRVVNGVSLAAADPIGDPEAWPGAIAAWQADAARHGWRTAVLGASEQGATIYQREAGLRVLGLGDEAVVDVATFDLRGRSMRTLRQAHARIDRAGYTVTAWRRAQLGEDTLREVADDADRWREGATERGFSMALGRLGDPQDPDYLVLRCTDRDGRPRAVLGFVPWGDDGISLDLMRRDRDTDNGLFEYMIVELFRQAADLGVRRVSLNFAMFREAFARGTRVGAGPVDRATYRVLMIASRWWQLESLYRANRKYQPTWAPRFVCFASVADLATVSVAAGRAEGFLP